MVPFEANSNTGGDGPDTLTQNNDAVFFALPVVWGTPIELGIYGLVLAGEDASALDTSANGAAASFQDTISYGGPGYAYDTDSNGNIVGGPVDVTLIQDAGINYNTSYAPMPEPGALPVLGVALLGVALLGMGLARRGLRRG